jgi:hypothetical protein
LSVDAQRKRTRTATSKGNFVVRVGLGVNHTKDDRDLDQVSRMTTINFTPSVGYMLVDNLELGVNFGLENYDSEDITQQNPQLVKTLENYTDVNFGVYAMKYFPLNNWFALTALADLGLSTGTFDKNYILGATTTPAPVQEEARGVRNGVGGSINVGFAFTPYNAFALQANIAGLGVQNMKIDPDGVNNSNNVTHVGFDVWRQTTNLSLVWYFGRGLWKK